MVSFSIGGASEGGSALVGRETDVYFRDVCDHLFRIIDTVETFRDMIEGLMAIHLSNVSNRMNEAMKTLTIMATLFIPLTFIAGVYGMNFEYMPELKWRGGYVGVLGLMAVVTGPCSSISGEESGSETMKPRVDRCFSRAA
jgi:magnesium transporter